MRVPRFHGDLVEFLRAYARFAYDDVGLQTARDFEKCVEEVIRKDAVHALELRDLNREIEDLKNE
jgi:hypothetical protein